MTPIDSYHLFHINPVTNFHQPIRCRDTIAANARFHFLRWIYSGSKFHQDLVRDGIVTFSRLWANIG
jgi:hypothetical protein